MINRKGMPGTGEAFVAALHGPLFIGLSGVRKAGGDFPKLFLAAYSPVPGISPCLINLWTFDDPDAKGRVVGGIAGPSDRPDRDWRLFAEALEAIKGRDAAGYNSLLDVVDGIVRAYVLSRPDRFTPLS